MSEPRCVFCPPDPSRVFLEADQVLGVWDAFPISPGHALVIPRRHVASWVEATEEERVALVRSVEEVRRVIEARHQPDGFNIGINVGEAAGQTVFHLHVHVIPRYRGDVADPRGGVRHVIPGRGNYQAGCRPAEGTGPARGPVHHRRVIVTGGADPFRPHLVEHLSRAARADLAVAFVSVSGVEEILPHLRELLDRGGRLRLLTGDYLDFTEPDALVRLCDLEDEHGSRVDLRVFETRREDAGTSFPRR